MPFELGLAVAWCELNESSRVKPRSEHIWCVFAAHRGIDQSFSDLLGSDCYIHNGQPRILFRELCNAVVRSHRRPNVEEMDGVFRDLKRALPKLMRKTGPNSPFTARVFDDLRLLAANLALG
jgi:hypothetical protein